MEREMFLTQYTHRLPADYDMGLIRNRAATRGPDWDSYPGLIFKGFLICEKGKSGAAANAYSSLYLWRDADAFAAMITGERFEAVISSFGRPCVETFVVLASNFGLARSPHIVRRTDRLIPREADLAALKDEETSTALQSAREASTFTAIAALDVSGWRIARFILSAVDLPETDANATDFEIAYLANPAQ
jgi:hypothetical protein